MNIFREGARSEYSWIRLSTIEAEKIELWNATFMKTGIDRDTATLPFRVAETERQEHRDVTLIAVLKEEIDALS